MNTNHLFQRVAIKFSKGGLIAFIEAQRETTRLFNSAISSTPEKSREAVKNTFSPGIARRQRLIVSLEAAIAAWGSQHKGGLTLQILPSDIIAASRCLMAQINDWNKIGISPNAYWGSNLIDYVVALEQLKAA